MTHQVIEAQFDEDTTRQLDRARQEIYERGFGTLPAGIPHMSLASFQHSNLAIWQSQLPRLAAQPQIEVRFSYLGLFRGEKFIVYMGVIPSQRLNALHADVHSLGLIAAGELHGHYHPDHITFHSTLASAVRREEVGLVMDMLTQFDLPKTGTLCRLALVEYFPAVTMLAEDFQPMKET